MIIDNTIKNFHSHISGLGATNSLPYTADGLVGQTKAREALSLFKLLIINRKASGMIIFLRGSGKSALIQGLIEEFSKQNKLYLNSADSKKIISGSNLYSISCLSAPQLSSSNIFRTFRRSSTIRLTEKVVIIEGEIVYIDTDRLKRITLKTTEMESQFEIGDKMAAQMDNLASGDIIRIRRNSGEVEVLGSTREDVNSFNIRECPEGEIINMVEEEKLITLRELDRANEEEFDQVDKKIREWVDEGICEVIPGLLVIEDGEFMSEEVFSCIESLCEYSWAPAVLIAGKNRNFRGEKYLEIRADEYKEDEIKKIIKCRLEDENLLLEDEEIDRLAEIAVSKGLQYIFNLVSIMLNNNNEENKKDIKKNIKELMELIK